MDATAIISGASCAVTVLVPLVGYVFHLERRMARLEALLETLTRPHSVAAKVYPWNNAK